MTGPPSHSQWTKPPLQQLAVPTDGARRHPQPWYVRSAILSSTAARAENDGLVSRKEESANAMQGTDEQTVHPITLIASDSDYSQFYFSADDSDSGSRFIIYTKEKTNNINIIWFVQKN